MVIVVGCLDEHIPWAIPFLFFPEYGIVKEDVEFEFVLEYRRLKRAILTNQDINLRQAKSFWRDGDILRAKKRVSHVFQMLHWCLDLLRHDKITDLIAANRYFNNLMQDFDSWESYHSFFHPLKLELIDEIRHEVKYRWVNIENEQLDNYFLFTQKC